MKEFQFSILLFFYLLSIQVTLVTAQGSSISFSPDRFLCNGDVVEMVCFVESSVPFSSNNARVSIDSSSPAFTLAQLDSDTVLNGVDLSRYTANIDGLTRTLDRPGIRVIISSYQPSDSNTVFTCHGVFDNGTESLTLASGQPNTAADDLSLLLINLEGSSTNVNLSSCTATVNLNWTILNQPTNSPLTVEQYFLYLNGTLIATVIPPLSSYSYNITSIQLNTSYIYSITAINCAGNTSDETTLLISVTDPPSTPIMVLDNLEIVPDISTSSISQALQSIKLIKSDLNTNNQIVDTIQDYSEVFSETFALDTCYSTETTVETCTTNSTSKVSSKYILYNLENIIIDECLSSEWVSGSVTLDVTKYTMSKISCSNEDYDTQFLADGLLSAMLIKRNDPTFSMNITNITLISPFRYNFTFVGKIVCEEVIFLEMYFNGTKMSNLEVPFCCPVVIVPVLPTITIILICTLILLLTLLFIVILLIVIFILIRTKKREGKKCSCLLLCWKKCLSHCCKKCLSHCCKKCLSHCGKKCSCHCGKECPICGKECSCHCEEKLPSI